MTKLTKPLTRRTSGGYRTLKNKPLVITLHPSEFGDYAVLKELHCRKGVRINLDTIYYAAVQAEVDRQRIIKAKERKLKRLAKKK